MRSPDSARDGELNFERDPESLVGQFEASITRSLERLKDQNLTHAQKKKVVRMLCLKNGQKLGLNNTDAQNAAMYFFRLTYENPDQAHVLWQNLYELFLLLENDQTEDRENKISEKVNQMFDLNDSGLTFFWRLIHSLVRGDLDVVETKIGGESIYYMKFPDNDTRVKRNTDKGRQGISSSIRENLKDKIIEKPLPCLPAAIKHFSTQDQADLRKIIIFLQQDADLLVLSSEWKQLIQKYFEDVAGFLNESISKIKLEENRSDARKNRYAEYVSEILGGYLTELHEYCLRMAETSEENMFAADAMLEPSLVTTGVLENGTDEPSIAVIVKRWQRLMRDIQVIVGDNATRFNIPAITTPVEAAISDGIIETGNNEPQSKRTTSSSGMTAFYHPALSGEIRIITPRTIAEHTGAAAEAAIGDRGRNELLEWAEGGSDDASAEPVSDQALPKRPKKPGIDNTIMGIKTIDFPVKPKEQMPVDPLADTVAVEPAKTEPARVRDKKGYSHAKRLEINYFEFFGSLTGSERASAEEQIKIYIQSELTALRNQILNGSVDLKTAGEIFLLRKINKDINSKFVLSDNLRRFFVNELCRFYKDLISPRELEDGEKIPDAVSQGYIFSTLRILFMALAAQMEIPKKLSDALNGADNRMPLLHEIDDFNKMPKIDDYPPLSTLMSDEDPVVAEINKYLSVAVEKMLNFSYLFDILTYMSGSDLDQQDDLIRYYQNQLEQYESFQAIIESMQKQKLGSRWQRFRNRALSNAIKKYFSDLSACVEQVWKKGIEPSVITFGKLILGKSRK